jgi:aspartate 1-decarboxylase
VFSKKTISNIILPNFALYIIVTMLIQVVKSKIHRVKVTQADLNYIGSITIDEDLMEAANVIEGEKVQIVNINNGERFETYVIKGDRKSGTICLNGPAARRVAMGDIIIIIGYGYMEFEEAKSFKPCLVFPNEETNLID